MLQFIN